VTVLTPPVEKGTGLVDGTIATWGQWFAAACNMGTAYTVLPSLLFKLLEGCMGWEKRARRLR